MHKKNNSKIVKVEFIRQESVSSESKFYRYGKFKETAYATLSCGHTHNFSELKEKPNGFCFCYDCKVESDKCEN